MIKKLIYVVWGIGMCIAFLYITYHWNGLNQFQDQSGLRYEEGQLPAKRIKDWYAVPEEERNVGITAWMQEENQIVSWKDTGRQVQGTAIKVYGDMALVLPFPMRSGGFSFPEDAKGCVVSSRLARDLFGSEDVTGIPVYFEDKEWIIRGVFDMERSVIAVNQTDESAAMPYVELKSEDGKPPAVKADAVKSSLGLLEESYEFSGSLYCSLVRLMMSLPFWTVFGYACIRFSRWGRQSPKGKYGRELRIAGRLLLLLIFFGGMYLSISFTSDFIPSQWSDFHFWSQKWKAVFQNFSAKGRFPAIFWEQQVRMHALKAAAGTLCFLAGLIFGLITKCVRTRKAPETEESVPECVRVSGK